MSKENLTRSTVNTEQYAAPEFQKSGFNLGYSRHSSYMLGRMHIGAYQHCMPGDKISGQNSFNGTFNRIVTPMVTPIRAMSYNFFLPYRAVDRTFEKGMTPTKNNAMSANWTAPTVSTRYLIDKIMYNYFLGTQSDGRVAEAELNRFANIMDDSQGQATDITILDLMGNNFESILYGGTVGSETYFGFVTQAIKSLTDSNGAFYKMAAPMYLCDALEDIANNITVKLGSATNPISGSVNAGQFLYSFFDCLLSPFIGRYSYYAELRYKYLRPLDLYKICIQHVVPMSGNTWSDFLNIFDNTQQNEYALRIMYVIWYERFRNVDLEPVSTTLPDWREFGSTSIFDMDNGGNLLYLIYRIRSWEKDMFTTAQIDDMSRHVYAPIYNYSGEEVGGHVSHFNNLDTNQQADTADVFSGGSKPAIYTLHYRDQFNDINSTIECPVPSNINDMLSSLDVSFNDVYGLDLNTLRQSQMLERYLKRNYLFGDEYKDRLLAHYNSRLSDMRINRPELLSQSINDYKLSQQVSNVSTEETKVGDRTATATIELGGDQFTTYCEEFGMIITIVTFMPSPMYDGDDTHNVLTKQVHFPLPEFAANNEEFGRKNEIAGSALDSSLNGDESNNNFMFGRYPAYHAWRSRTDEVGGMFLDELQDCTYRRFWGNYSLETTPKLNYQFIHCRPNLQMFANSIAYDCQLYGTLVQNCLAERVLPTPIETI